MISPLAFAYNKISLFNYNGLLSKVNISIRSGVFRKQPLMKIAFYYNHYNTLGHSTRVFSLVRGLKEAYGRKCEILILLGGPQQPFFPFRAYACVKALPYAFDKRGLAIEANRKLYNHLIQGPHLNAMLKERLKISTKALQSFQPDVFITEYYPFGQEFWTFELPRVLDFLKSRFPVKIVSSSGYISWTPDMQEIIRKYYDLLLIHSPRTFGRDYAKYIPPEGSSVLDSVFRDNTSRIHFTGFISELSWADAPSPKIRRLLADLDQPCIFVSRGGGIVNKKIILTALLAAQRNTKWNFLLVCGPSTPREEWETYHRIAKSRPHIHLFKSLIPADFIACMKKADLCISMAGYNTSVKLMELNKSCILIPYKTTEQIWRACLLKRSLQAEIISEKDLSAGILENKIQSLLERKKPGNRLPSSWFQGTETTLQFLEDGLRE